MITGARLHKTYVGDDGSRVRALNDVSFSVPEGEFYVLLGPSGSGKTTTLRAIAGLDQPDSGQIAIDGRLVFAPENAIRVPPEERPIAMVFQSYALWPHMDVHDNIAFPLRRGIRRVSKDEMARRVGRVVELLRLKTQLHRPVSTLSGGQQQRVALARALALEPAVLLMDEPLSNLDARLRAELRLELKEIARSIGITTVYVTHDQTEAMVMGDRIAVMAHGRILQEGTPWTLYQQPAALFVAEFLGEMNFISGQIEPGDGGCALVATGVGPLNLVRSPTTPTQGSVVLGFRPEDAVLTRAPGENVIRARVTARHYLGDAFLYQARSGEISFDIRRPKAEQLELGAEIFVHLPRAACIAFSRDADKSAEEQFQIGPCRSDPQYPRRSNK
jgi:ABC-type Fe3+/spermidine/putrescine transport system ATPase subunit